MTISVLPTRASTAGQPPIVPGVSAARAGAPTASADIATAASANPLAHIIALPLSPL